MMWAACHKCVSNALRLIRVTAFSHKKQCRLCANYSEKIRRKTKQFSPDPVYINLDVLLSILFSNPSLKTAIKTSFFLSKLL